DAAGGLRFGINSFDNDAVMKRTKFHWCPPGISSKGWRIGKLIISSGTARSGGLVERLRYACLDRLGSISRKFLNERIKLLALRGDDVELLAKLRGRQLDKLGWRLHTQ